MKKIHLDFGTHYGQGLFQFINILGIDKSWEIYSFEANPITYQNFLSTQQFQLLINNLKIRFFNKAIYTRNGTIKFNLEHPKDSNSSDGMGSTIIDLDDWKPQNGTLVDNFRSSLDIECVDISEFINCLGECEITCKMDIEGAEFDILEKMIENKSILKFKSLWVEFHNNFFVDRKLYSSRKNKIINYLNTHNIPIYDWF